MTSIDIPDEALSIATRKAREAGEALAGWVIRAITTQAANQEPIDEIPFDDCGFPSPAWGAA